MICAQCGDKMIGPRPLEGDPDRGECPNCEVAYVRAGPGDPWRTAKQEDAPEDLEPWEALAP